MNFAPLNADDLRLLIAIDRDGPILCDKDAVNALLTHGLVERTELGWGLSAKGRRRLLMHR